MADGGFRSAYNAQLAGDCQTRVIVGVEVVTTGSDLAQLAPMVDQVEGRCGRLAGQWRVDGGYPAREQLEAVDDRTEVHAPVPAPRPRTDEQGNPVEHDKHAPKRGDSAAVAGWRQPWAVPRRRRSTATGRPRPSASTRRPATAA